MNKLGNLVVCSALNAAVLMSSVVFAKANLANMGGEVGTEGESIEPELLSGSWAGKVRSDQVAHCDISFTVDYMETRIVVGNRRLDCGPVVNEFESISLEKHPNGELFLDGNYMGDWFESETEIDIFIKGDNLRANQFIDAVIYYNSLQDKITYYDEEHINFTTGLHKHAESVNGLQKSTASSSNPLNGSFVSSRLKKSEYEVWGTAVSDQCMDSECKEKNKNEAIVDGERRANLMCPDGAYAIRLIEQFSAYGYGSDYHSWAKIGFQCTYGSSN